MAASQHKPQLHAYCNHLQQLIAQCAAADMAVFRQFQLQASGFLQFIRNKDRGYAGGGPAVSPLLLDRHQRAYPALGKSPTLTSQKNFKANLRKFGVIRNNRQAQKSFDIFLNAKLHVPE